MENKKKRKKNKYGKGVYRSLAMITQFGINMLVPIFLCSFAGIFLDRLLHTSFLMVVLFFVGALAGFRNIYIFSRRIFNADTDRSRGQVEGSDTSAPSDLHESKSAHAADGTDRNDTKSI